jgi:endonuclease YncB( thermonuclease family)
MIRLLLRPLFRSLRPPITLVAVLALIPLVGLNNCAPETGAPSPPAVSSSPAATDLSGRVTRIVDGDTFWISSQDVRIRV